MAEFLTMDTQGYPYGLNWSRPPEAIADNELVTAENCEYDPKDNALKSAAGLSLIKSGSYKYMSYSESGNCFYLVDMNNHLWLLDRGFSSSKDLGALNSTGDPDIVVFGSEVFVASGGTLQYVKDGALSNVTNAPKASHCFVRQSRLVCYNTDEDVLKYSAIGDAHTYTVDTNDLSKGATVNVGYKDPGHITAVSFLADCILVFKSSGTAYKITGEPQNSSFAVKPVSQTAYAINSRCACALDSKVYYLGSDGFKSFIPTNAYGDVLPYDEGGNINGVLSKEVTSKASIYLIKNRKQIWIRPDANSSTIYVYHYLSRYNDGRGAFTTRIDNINDVCEADNSVYAVTDSGIYRLIDSTENGSATIVGANKLTTMHSLLVMNRLLIMSADSGNCSGTIKCGKKIKPFSSASKKAAISTLLMDITTTQHVPAIDVAEDGYVRNYKVGGGSNKAVQLVISVDGVWSLRCLQYQYLEV